MVNIIENSYGHPYIKLDEEHFKAVQSYKKENYAVIYANEPGRAILNRVVKPMMEEIYEQLLDDLIQDKQNSPILLHHVDYVNQSRYSRPVRYGKTEPNEIVVDYIASMTDNYFIELHGYRFPNSPLQVQYKGYFDE